MVKSLVLGKVILRSNVVYLIRVKNTTYYKIGLSIDPSKRLSSIQSSCPLEVEIVKIWDGELDEECRLHNIFGQYRMHGEWYSLMDNIVESLVNLKSLENAYRDLGYPQEEEQELDVNLIPY